MLCLYSVVVPSVMSEFLWPHGLQHARLPCPSLFLGVWSNSCPLSWWCHQTIASSVAPFSSCPQSFPQSGSLPMSCLFTSGGLSIGTSALVTVFPINIQGWFPLGLTGFIFSLLSKAIKIARRNINNLRYADNSILMAKSEEELKSLFIKVKEKNEKAGLKLNIQKTKIMASSPSLYGK